MQLNFRPTLPHERAVVTGLFTDTYAYSAAVLGHSLKRVNIDARMIAMYIPGHVSEESLCLAKSQGWEPQPIERIPPPHNGHNIDPKFVDQYTKLQLWSFDKLGIRSVVFFDADVVVRRPIPIHLFDLPFSFAAVPDGIQSPLINGGGLFLKTDSRIRDDMVIKMETAPFNLAWAEQNFLNLYWGGHVLILPWIFNANIWIKYQSSKLWEGMLDELVALHMTSAKPFPHYDVGGVLTLEEMKVAIEWKFESHRQSEYDFSQELQWWLDEWERMVGDSRSQLTTCVPTSVGNAKTTLMEAGIPFPP
ncbi:nucleotide-diphospho-sugar transferase [Flagelloscypha sp. PMI_526]|nr:nucleotide-diphospho-sugar transferase [Flagelloscypha sp. PMI_526]